MTFGKNNKLAINMGTWGHHAFQNDDAGDFESTLEGNGLAAIESAFDAVLENEGYLEAPESQSGVAAAEALCVVLGRPGPSIPDEVTTWAKEREAPPEALVFKAKRSLTRILKDSELRELWSDSAEFSDWEESVLDVVRRLG